MCGIAGFIGQRDVTPATLEAMLRPLRPRGPDASRIVSWDGQWQQNRQPVRAALLHTRLSVRDPRPEADQPMRDADGTGWICYNGEVYGWQTAADTLRQKGTTFRTRSDTEFILHAYAAWGIDFLRHLRGMFALALLDLRQRKLLLIRDRLGIKPLLYYHRPGGVHTPGEVVFGSTLRALLPYLPTEHRVLSPEGIDAFLAHRYIPAPRTVFRHVHRLLPGHWAEFNLDTGHWKTAAYWRPHPSETPQSTADLVREAVALRTETDRPLGLFLSGGIDSSTVASALAETGHTHSIALTAGFPGSSLDESRQAAEVAKQLGLPHRVITCQENVADDFERLVADLDEPFADPSAIPLWYLAREARKTVVSVLGGDGGDELFAGYKRYAKHLSSAWRGNVTMARKPYTSDRLPGRWQKIVDELGMAWLPAYALRFSGMSPALRDYLQPDHLHRAFIYWRPLEPDASRSPLHTLLAWDMENYLPEYILRKADLCTMAHGLELRVPLLDHRLVENTLALPAHVRFSRPPKQALGAVCAICTQLKLFSQPKRGFNPPLDRWLKQDLGGYAHGLGERLQARTLGQLNAQRVDGMVSAYQVAGEHKRAEQVLQLFILDVSLRQLTGEMAR